MYLASFGEMAAAYPQVLIAKRSYYRAQADYTKALVSLWQQGLGMQGFLLGGGLDAPGETRTEIGGRSKDEGVEDR